MVRTSPPSITSWAGQKTLSPDKGLFLPETWRLHPDISAYTSELFYEGKLTSRDGLDQQVIHAEGPRERLRPALCAG